MTETQAPYAVDDLITKIRESAAGTAEAMRARCLCASLVKDLRKNDYPAYERARNEFEIWHGRTLPVWARVVSRFPEYFDATRQEWTTATADTYTSLAYMCQLSTFDCAVLFHEFYPILQERNVHMTILTRVNAIKHRTKQGRKPRECPYCGAPIAKAAR